MKGPGSQNHRKRLYSFALLLVILIIALNEQRALYHYFDKLRQTHPWSHQYDVEKAFIPTPEELDCLYGNTAAPISSGSIEPIPNHAHFIFGLGNPYESPEAGSFDFLAFLAVRSATLGLRATRVFLHYTYLAEPPSPKPNMDPYTNPWTYRLKENVTLVYHPPEEIGKLKDSSGAQKPAHISDLLRLLILKEQGGIYLDIDAFALRPFTNVLDSPRGMVMGHEGGNRAGLCNAIMVARADSPFINRWIADYEDADLSKEWNYHSVILPKRLQLEHSEDICVLPPTSFFWPTWTWHHVDWMHESLSSGEAQYWAKEVERNGGSLFER